MGSSGGLIVSTATTAPLPTGDATGVQDTLNVNSVLAASNAGDAIFFHSGRYNLNTVIGYPSQRRYIGAMSQGSAATEMFMVAGANQDAVWASAEWLAVNPTPVSASPVNFEFMTFNANRTNQSGGAGHGLVTMNFHADIWKCKTNNTTGDGIRVSSGNQGGNVITNTLNEVRIEQCELRFAHGDGIRIFEQDATARVTDGFCINNIISGDPTDTGAGNAIRVDKGSGWEIADNHTYAMPQNGIRCGNMFSTKIIGNYCEGFGWSTTVGIYCGINASIVGVLGSAASLVNDNVVWANSVPVAGTTLRGVAVTADNGNTIQSVVTGNTGYGRTFGTPTTGLVLNCSDGAGIHNSACSGNNFPNWDTPYVGSATGSVRVAASGNAGMIVVNEAFSATPTILPNKAALNGLWRMIMTANVVVATVPVGVDGQIITVQFENDATNRTVTWPANVINAPAMTAGANAVRTWQLQYFANATGGAKWYCVGSV